MTTILEAQTEAVVNKVASLFEGVKALPRDDQQAFTQLFYHWKMSQVNLATRNSADAGTPEPTPPGQMPDFAARLNKLFPDGPITGDSEAFWEEERADRC